MTVSAPVRRADSDQAAAIFDGVYFVGRADRLGPRLWTVDGGGVASVIARDGGTLAWGRYSAGTLATAHVMLECAVGSVADLELVAGFARDVVQHLPRPFFSLGGDDVALWHLQARTLGER